MRQSENGFKKKENKQNEKCIFSFHYGRYWILNYYVQMTSLYRKL